MKLNLKSNLLLLSSLVTLILAMLLSPGMLSAHHRSRQDPDEADSHAAYPLPQKGCLAGGCHWEIEPIREHHSGMAQEIYSLGKEKGDPNGCVVCHFGDPEALTSEKAHKGIVRYPASMWVNDQTCGKCHSEYVYTINRNLMQTEAGKIQGAVWGWGAMTGYRSIYGNYGLGDPDGKTPLFGNEAYKSYMEKLMSTHSYAFPDSLIELPEVDLATLHEHPEQAVFTYIRSDCQRCHVGVRGAQRRGDYHGLGCAACHIPYSDEGFYEGLDPSIPCHAKGKMLVHSIQSSRKAKVTVNGVTWSGIPGEMCSSCHNRGKRIGVSYLGMIESAYDTPWDEQGNGQPRLHGKNYQYIKEDFHHSRESREGNPEGGLLCQDCHQTTDVHGNGNIGGTTFGEVEIECSDCHGTPFAYPWELPPGFGDEFGIEPGRQVRGVTATLLDVQERFSTVYEPEDGYLLTARGNPMGNVVRREDKVIVHSAGGADFRVPVLKNLAAENQWKHPEKAITAMMMVKRHMEKLECYSCHSGWAAQCYGCHVKVDYSKNYRSVDWVRSGKLHEANGETAETRRDRLPVYQPGKITEGRTYIRWENPVLGINGEGRVSPIIPGCQQITTVIDQDGEPLFTNKIWRTPGGMEGSGPDGQKGIDMTPAQPHTVTSEARECVSCHADPKALGYGIADNRFMQGYNLDRYMDLQTTTKQLISRRSVPQFPSIPGLDMDLSRIVSRDGKQMQTVGHHWELSGPLTQEQREKMERIGVCISCHQDIPDGSLPVRAMVAAGNMFDLTPVSDTEHSTLLNKDIRFAALSRLAGPFALAALLALIFIIFRQYKRIRSLNRQ